MANYEIERLTTIMKYTCCIIFCHNNHPHMLLNASTTLLYSRSMPRAVLAFVLLHRRQKASTTLGNVRDYKEVVLYIQS